MSRILIDHVTKIYAGDVKAADDVSLEIASGEFMVLVGPSGCGKSTLMRMVAGLEDVTEGTIYIGDEDVTDLSPRNRDIAMVFQNYALYPHMSVRKNLGYGLKVRKTPRAEIEPPRRGGREVARARGAARPPSRGAVGRSASARRDGTGDRPRAGGLPHGRAAVEPRREAAGEHARRALAPARAARSDDRVRDPRPGRGDDARPAGGGDARRPYPAGGRAAESLQGAREPVRRRVHRLAVDEPRGGDRRRRGRGVRRASGSRSHPSAVPCARAR